MAQISFRVDDDVKRDAEKTLDAIGLSMSAAMNIFLKTVARERRIPFELSADPFYAETARYFKESERGVEQMCRVLDMKFEQGYEKGAANMLSTIMQNMNLTEEQVIKALNITPEEYAHYKKLASEMRSDA